MKRVLCVGSIALVGVVAAVSLYLSRDVRRVAGKDAEFLLVRGDYALVILRPHVLRTAFGNDWVGRSLYYGCNRAILDSGERATVSPTPLEVLPVAPAMLMISGDDWSDVQCIVYSRETRDQVSIQLNLRKSTIRLSDTIKREGQSVLDGDGRLSIR
jgi:hypothetical protein